MNIQQKKYGADGRFFIEEDGRRVALLTYTDGGNGRIVIDHTEVDPSLQGKHIGYELVEKTVAFARAEGLKIMPSCPFAKAVFDKQPAFADVLAEE